MLEQVKKSIPLTVSDRVSQNLLEKWLFDFVGIFAFGQQASRHICIWGPTVEIGPIIHVSLLVKIFQNDVFLIWCQMVNEFVTKEVNEARVLRYHDQVEWVDFVNILKFN